MGTKKTKEEFALQTKKGQVVYEINLNIRNKEDVYNTSRLYPDGLFVKEHKIALQTNRKIALNNEQITCFDRLKAGQRKESYHHPLEYIDISIRTKETYFPNGIFCIAYTIQNPEKVVKQIKRKIINKINTDYGFLRSIDIETVIDEMQIQKQ